MSFSKIVLATSALSSLLAFAQTAGACSSPIKPGVYINNAHQLVDIATPSCDVVTIHQQPTQPKEQMETWEIHIDGRENSLPKEVLDRSGHLNESIAKKFRFTITPGKYPNELVIEAKRQRVPLNNPVNGKIMTTALVNYKALARIESDRIILDTESLQLAALPALGVDLAAGVSSEELPVWKKGFIAGANFVFSMFTGELREELILKR